MSWGGERAMVSTECSQPAYRNQLQLIHRAKHKTAWVFERHNGILRNACHKTRTHLAAEGIPIKSSHVLADVAYSKNALLTIGEGEGTPYLALLGRVPPLLPQIEHIAGTAHLNDETGVEGSRHLHRLREVTFMFP